LVFSSLRVKYNHKKEKEMTANKSANIIGTKKMPKPDELIQQNPLTSWQEKLVTESRVTIERILAGKDDRLLLIVGPCSIHDPEAGLDFAKRLKELSYKVQDSIYIVMRCYFEKPRTTVGWKGLITSPDITYQNDFVKGINTARKFMIDVIDLGLPIATEFLDPLIPPYISDCVSWAAIGARTTESQTHRQMASGLSMPVGFKNGTAGQYQLAIDGIVSASQSGSFLGIDDGGQAAEIVSTGNDNCHVVLRGGSDPRTGETIKNYTAETIQEVADALGKIGQSPKNIIVDCSHANSDKDHQEQQRVFSKHLVDRFQEGLITGGMVESNIKPGSQSGKVPPFNKGPEAFEGFDPKKDLEYGMSITDSCIGWEDTESMILDAHEKLIQERSATPSAA
jgi:3-deoxy-7-phosphoheptulonate synthase